MVNISKLQLFETVRKGRKGETLDLPTEEDKPQYDDESSEASSEED